jgi:hypothetical protein
LIVQPVAESVQKISTLSKLPYWHCDWMCVHYYHNSMFETSTYVWRDDNMWNIENFLIHSAFWCFSNEFTLHTWKYDIDIFETCHSDFWHRMIHTRKLQRISNTDKWRKSFIVIVTLKNYSLVTQFSYGNFLRESNRMNVKRFTSMHGVCEEGDKRQDVKELKFFTILLTGVKVEFSRKFLKEICLYWSALSERKIFVDFLKIFQRFRPGPRIPILDALFI